MAELPKVERLSRLVIEHSSYLSRIAQAWRRADEVMQTCGLDPHGAGYENLARDERRPIEALVGDYHDHVVMHLLPLVSDSLRDRLLMFADGLLRMIRDPRSPWPSALAEDLAMIDRLLAARLRALQDFAAPAVNSSIVKGPPGTSDLAMRADEFLQALCVFVELELLWRTRWLEIRNPDTIHRWRRYVEARENEGDPKTLALLDSFREINAQRNSLLDELRSHVATLSPQAEALGLDSTAFQPFGESDPPSLDAVRPAWHMAKRMATRVGAVLNRPLPELPTASDQPPPDPQRQPDGQSRTDQPSVPPDDSAATEQYVTLDTAAAWVKRSKRTLEKRKGKGLPQPTVKGGGGAPDEWAWSVIRPWLEETFGRKLPPRLPDPFRGGSDRR